MDVENDIVGQEHVYQDVNELVLVICLGWLPVDLEDPVKHDEGVEKHVNEREKEGEGAEESEMCHVEWNLENQGPAHGSLYKEVPCIKHEHPVSICPPIIHQDVENKVENAQDD